MKGMLKLWGNSLIEPFKNVYKILTDKYFWDWVIGAIMIILSPLIVFYGVIYLFLIVGSFIFWNLPKSIPIPFYNPLFGFGSDRFLILIGVIVFIVLKLESKNRE